MLPDDQWFTEICVEGGSAFSLKLKSKLHEEKTPYQTIAIYDTETFGHLMIIDGCTMVSQRENFIYHEMMSHPALFTHDNPENVVIIGGGDCGTLREVLRHDKVKSATQIELDERVPRLAEQYFPELCEANNDSRAHFYFGDGIRWMQQAPANSIDIIIIDSTDPVGPAEGLFTESFYRDCYQALRKGGIIVQQSESPLFHLDIIKAMRHSMRAAGFSTTRTLQFYQCIYPSGWWSCTLAGKDRNLDELREHDINNRNFESHYYNVDIHRAAGVLPEFVRTSLND